MFLGKFDRFLTIRGFRAQVVALFYLKNSAQRCADYRVVVSNQDSSSHGPRGRMRFLERNRFDD
jgi:hypothetical protein